MARRSKAERTRAEARGRRAEFVASLLLRAKGYSILASRVRTPQGEVDLIAKRGRVVAFVEVKQRRNQRTAHQAVSQRNWQRIAAAAETWIARRPDLNKCDWRYDLIAVIPWKFPQHMPDFWRP
ncbi:unnamed protein product [Chrysoparadoxa australica]